MKAFPANRGQSSPASDSNELEDYPDQRSRQNLAPISRELRTNIILWIGVCVIAGNCLGKPSLDVLLPARLPFLRVEFTDSLPLGLIDFLTIFS